MRILKEDIIKKVKYIEDRLGFKLQTSIDIDGRRKRVYVGNTIFSFEEFMSIDVDKLFWGMSRKS